MNYNFSDISKIPEYLSEMQKRQNDFDKKLKTIEKEFDRKLREKNQEISELKRQINSNEILANCRRNNEIFDNLSTKLNDAERTIKQAISKAAKIERLANNTDKTLDYLKTKIEEMQKILELKDSIKETIIIGDSIRYEISKDYYLVCPNCQCRNPHIENVNIDIDHREFNVSYYCACNILNKEPKSSSLSLSKSSCSERTISALSPRTSNSGFAERIIFVRFLSGSPLGNPARVFLPSTTV
jgi:hypothetical protein